MHYNELVGFDLILMGVRLKSLQIRLKFTDSIGAKDTTLGIDEPPFTELMFQLLCFSWHSLIEYKR
jgi:hypothetical protein